MKWLPTEYIDIETGEVFTKEQLKGHVYKIEKRKTDKVLLWNGATEYYNRETVYIKNVTKYEQLTMF